MNPRVVRLVPLTKTVDRTVDRGRNQNGHDRGGGARGFLAAGILANELEDGVGLDPPIVQSGIPTGPEIEPSVVAHLEARDKPVLNGPNAAICGC